VLESSTPPAPVEIGAAARSSPHPQRDTPFDRDGADWAARKISMVRKAERKNSRIRLRGTGGLASLGRPITSAADQRPAWAKIHASASATRTPSEGPASLSDRPAADEIESPQRARTLFGPGQVRVGLLDRPARLIQPPEQRSQQPSRTSACRRQRTAEINAERDRNGAPARHRRAGTPSPARVLQRVRTSAGFGPGDRRPHQRHVVRKPMRPSGPCVVKSRIHRIFAVVGPRPGEPRRRPKTLLPTPGLRSEPPMSRRRASAAEPAGQPPAARIPRPVLPRTAAQVVRG